MLRWRRCLQVLPDHVLIRFIASIWNIGGRSSIPELTKDQRKTNCSNWYSMRRSAIEILAVTLAVAATLPLVSRVLADGQTTTSGTSGALQAARDRAASPFSFTRAQWKSLFLRVYRAIGADQVGLLSAGVAFYALFALFPGLGAATWLFSLLADPGTIQQQVNKLRDVVPAEAYKLIEQQLVALSSKNSAGFSAAGVISLLLALYSARLAASSMMQALNAIYKLQETRGLIKTNAIAILFTVVAIVVFSSRSRCWWSCRPCSGSLGSHRSWKTSFAIFAGRCLRSWLSSRSP